MWNYWKEEEPTRDADMYSQCPLYPSPLGAASVVITDRNPEPAKRNLKLNSNNLDPQRPVAVRELTWGQDVSDFRSPYDVILAADVVYIEETFPSLIQCLEALSGVHTTILLSCKYRYERDSRFLRMLSEKFVSKVVWTSGDFSIHNIRVQQLN